MTVTGIFRYLKRGKDPDVLRELNRFMRFSTKLACANTEFFFLEDCLTNHHYPTSYLKILRRNRINITDQSLARHTRSVKETICAQIVELNINYERSLCVLDQLTDDERDSFEDYVKHISDIKAKELSEKLSKQLNSTPVANQFPDNPDRYVHNLSSVVPDKTLLEVLSLGPKFCCLKKKPRQLDLEVQFESLFSQLFDLTPSSDFYTECLKSTLVNTCYQYLQSETKGSRLLKSKHLEALKVLQKNRNIMLSKPDKGAGVVILNKKDYIDKMLVILEDETKFKRMTKEKDKTPGIEKTISKKLRDLKLREVIDTSTFELLRPIGCTIPRLYGLPKIHKPGTPLRPILDMYNSHYHSIAKWLTKLLEPVRKEIVTHTVTDTFDFVRVINDLNLQDKKMLSLDVSSLFTNVPVRETIDYIVDVIDRKKIILVLPTSDLKKLLSLCTENIQFTFNDTIYRQKDGVAMGSPLGPLFADIFMSKLENDQLKQTIEGITCYKRYVDDIFFTIESTTDIATILNSFNSAHSNLNFTLETEIEDHMNFLDVRVTRRPDGTAQRSMHRKSTWTGQYLHYQSFVPHQQKVNLVRTLAFRSTRICSEDTIEHELRELRSIFLQNGYPERLLEKYIRVIQPVSKSPTANRKKVYISLPFKGDELANKTKQSLSTKINKVFGAAELHINFHSVPAIHLHLKDKLPISATSFCVYNFSCSCGASYIGRTARRLSDRIREHCPAWLSKGMIKSVNSSILAHLVDHNHSVDFQTSFRPIYTVNGRLSKPIRHRLLAIAEAIGIRLFKPVLCLMKNYVRTLGLQWPSHTQAITCAGMDHALSNPEYCPVQI